MKIEFTTCFHTRGPAVRGRGRSHRNGPAVRELLAWVGACGVALATGGCGGDDVPAPQPAPFAIVAAGDIAQCLDGPPSASGAARTAPLVASSDELVLTLGDNAYQNGTPQEFAGCFDPTWGALKERIRAGIGNHDDYTANAEGYFGYFGARAGPDRRGYYSFDYRGWHFISLNSVHGVSADSEQYRWLLADLASSRATLCTIAYWHYPLFNSGARHGPAQQMKPFFDALYAGGVDIVLSGHEHLYERFAPQTADSAADPARGVRQFTVGTGGAALDTFAQPLPNSEARVAGHWGILRLTLGDGRYSWQFVPAGGGAALDSGQDVCHR